MFRRKTGTMNESKYPKPLGYLLALNLVALLAILILTMDDIRDGLRSVMGMQSIVMALGLALIGLPLARGKRLGMLGILGMAIAAPVIVFLCATLFADAVEMEGADRRVFTLLSFYASAIPLTFLGLVIAQDGWGANLKSVRRLFLMNIVFLLGLVGVTLDDAEAGLKAFMAIQFAMILQTLFLVCLPIVRGWRWRILGLGIMASAGSILITIFCAWVMIERLKLSGSDEAGALVLFVAAIPLNLIALFLLRHGWIAEEAKRRVGGLGNALLALNLLAPIGLYALALGLSDGGSRDGEWLLLVPGWLFAADLALMFLGRGVGGLQPIKPLRGAGEMSFLAAAAMLSVAFLIDESQGGGERDFYLAVGFGVLGLLALHHVMRGFASRWIGQPTQRFLFKWSVRGVFAMTALLVAGVPSYYVVGGWLGERAWAKYKAASEAEGWHYDFADYTGEIPPDDENFFMAKPFSGYLFTQEKGKKPVYHNPAIKEEFEAIVDLRIEPQHRILGRQFVHWADYAQQIRSEAASRRLEKIASATDGTDAEVLAAYFAQFDTLFSELREAAKRPKQHMPLAYENALTMFSAYFSPIKSLSQLLHTATLAKLANGNAEGAMADVRLAFRIVEVMSSETTLLGHLVYTAQLNLAVQCLNDGLHMGGWNDAHLAEWDELLAAQTGLFAKMERATQLERIWGGTTFD